MTGVFRVRCAQWTRKRCKQLAMDSDSGKGSPQLKQAIPGSSAWFAEARQSSEFPMNAARQPGGGLTDEQMGRRAIFPGWGHSARRRPALGVCLRWRVSATGPPDGPGSGTNGPIRTIPSQRRGTRFHENSGRNCTSVHAKADGGSLECSRTLFEPCPRACSALSPGVAAGRRARRLRKEHIARLCPPTDIDGSTGSTRCALGRGTSTGTCCGRSTLINRGRRLRHGAGIGFSWPVVSSSSLWSSGSWDCRPTIRRCAPRHLWRRRGRSYPTICRTDRRSCPRPDAPSWLPTSKRWKRMPTMRRRSSRDPSE